MTVTDAPTVVMPDVDTDRSFLDQVAPYDSGEDPILRTHIIRPYENTHIWQKGMTAQGVVDLARLNRTPIVALCGHKWVPVHNPDKYDMCDPCIKIAGELDANPNSHD